MLESGEVSKETQCFDEDAAGVLRCLRGAIAEVIEAIPEDVSSASDLQRALQIDKMLSWKLFRLITATCPLAAGIHVPGAANLKTFFRAAGRRGKVPADLIETAMRRVQDFERLVSIHAGDRATFNSMIGARAGSDSREQLSLRHRRAAFKANRHFWGIQAKTQLKAMFLQPGDEPGRMDLAVLDGFLNLRRLRQNAPLAISWARVANDDGTIISFRREPLDPHAENALGISLFEEFCSKPIPEIRILEAEGGFVLGELSATGVGKTATVTCLSGFLGRNAFTRYRDELNHLLECWAMVRTACEVLILDMVVRKDTFHDATPMAAVYGEHLNETAYPARSRELDRYPPLPASVVNIGRGASAMHTPDVPHYPRMARRVFDRLGADGEDFEVYRCRIEYPVMPSTALIRFNLPEEPQSQD